LGGIVLRRVIFNIAALVAFWLLSSECWASDIFSPVPILDQKTDIISRPNSVFVFAGRMSATDIYSTAILNVNQPGRTYDNYIVGAAFGRDMLDLGHHFVLGAEIGVADRFGKYSVCCDAPVVSSNVVQSGELWGGVSLRYDSIKLFDRLYLTPGVVGGFSGTTNSIGREREREIDLDGNARLLLYLGAELAFSTPGSPVDLVIRLHHRSGANGTFGRLMEGYNADVVGIRYRY
jgi:hypothetical protein